ncbi:hypothetical protein LJR225_004302 [Phenylobacterium sp. LjRoot225]|uniref:hypothetical protein n=1 Tax=Phenylobacterium sp. LjRoot225 TaxID=3342285 RepID=UPI003ECF97DB
MLRLAYKLHSGDDADGDGAAATPSGGVARDGEDLPYKVEVWDPAGDFVEQVVAVSANPAIGFAAYYAAAREFPGRDVTLRHMGRVLSRWPGRAH